MSALTAYDFFVITGNTVTFPQGQGRGTATASNNIATANKRVLIHAIIAMNGTNGTLNVLQADGTTNYFGLAFSVGTSAPGANLDIELINGLSVQGVTLTAGGFVIVYKLLG